MFRRNRELDIVTIARQIILLVSRQLPAAFVCPPSECSVTETIDKIDLRESLDMFSDKYLNKIADSLVLLFPPFYPYVGEYNKIPLQLPKGIKNGATVSYLGDGINFCSKVIPIDSLDSKQMALNVEFGVWCK